MIIEGMFENSPPSKSRDFFVSKNQRIQFRC